MGCGSDATVGDRGGEERMALFRVSFEVDVERGGWRCGVVLRLGGGGKLG